MNIKQISWFDKRFYKVELDDKSVRFIPSITTKLNIIDKPYLRKWVGEIGLREADMRLFEAGERGSRIHAAFDVMQKGGIIIYQPWQRPTYSEEELKEIQSKNPIWCVVKYQDEMLALYRLHKCMEILKPKVLMTEMTVVNLDENDAGTVDAVYEIEEGDYMINGSKPLHLEAGIYVADLKTGKQIDKSAYRQCAAYLKALKAMKLYDAIGTLILHTTSQNRGGIEGFGVHLRNKNQVEQDYKEYRFASSLWEAEHGDETPKLIEFPSILTLNKQEK